MHDQPSLHTPVAEDPAPASAATGSSVRVFVRTGPQTASARSEQLGGTPSERSQDGVARAAKQLSISETVTGQPARIPENPCTQTAWLGGAFFVEVTPSQLWVVDMPYPPNCAAKKSQTWPTSVASSSATFFVPLIPKLAPLDSRSRNTPKPRTSSQGSSQERARLNNQAFRKKSKLPQLRQLHTVRNRDVRRNIATSVV